MNKRIIPPGDPRWRLIRQRASIARIFRIDVRLLGPGLGYEHEREMVERALRHFAKSVSLTGTFADSAVRAAFEFDKLQFQIRHDYLAKMSSRTYPYPLYIQPPLS